ncbi:MAG TPA: hypothetical protein VMV86_03425 [Methanosarcinales archaeon]|nr:hypothetical protein [Methanosarcinales archaeon]
MIYLDKLTTKLNAILAKDLDDIIAKNTYIPFMGNDYTKTQLQSWLGARSILLNAAKTINDSQVSISISLIYNSLSKEDKKIADAIITGEPYELTTTADGYEKLVKIILYKFVTTP